MVQTNPWQRQIDASGTVPVKRCRHICTPNGLCGIGKVSVGSGNLTNTGSNARSDGAESENTVFLMMDTPHPRITLPIGKPSLRMAKAGFQAAISPD